MSLPRLIKELKEKNTNLNQIELNQIVSIFSKSISDALKNRNAVEIRGLGRFYCKKLKENFNARNPASNKLIYKPERIKIRFKASKKLNKKINEN